MALTIKPLAKAEMWNAGHSWHFRRLYDRNGLRLRVRIERNAYDNQSHGVIEVFSTATMSWNVLWSTPPVAGALHCLGVSYVTKPLSAREENLFLFDAGALLDAAELILA